MPAQTKHAVSVQIQTVTAKVTLYDEVKLSRDPGVALTLALWVLEQKKEISAATSAAEVENFVLKLVQTFGEHHHAANKQNL